MAGKCIRELALLLFDRKTNRGIFSSRGASLVHRFEFSPAGAGIHIGPILGMRRAGRQIDFTPTADAGISAPVFDQLLNRFGIKFEPAALIDRTLIPVDAEPAKIVDRLSVRSDLDARPIEVFDAQNDLPAVLSRE